MIEFRERSNRKKSSRWTKKYPRTIINRLGGDREAIKQTNWYRNNYKDDKWKRAFKSIGKFLKHNVGRPVDKVFSEFIKRCDSSTSSYNLRKVFYDHIKKKEEITWAGGFYVTNGILNYKKRTARPKCKPSIDRASYNLEHIRDIKAACKEADSTRAKQFMGMLYINGYSNLNPVYLIRGDVFNEELYWLRYRVCYIYGIGDYITAGIFGRVLDTYQKTIYYTGCSNFRENVSQNRYANYLFITKIKKQQNDG